MLEIDVKAFLDTLGKGKWVLALSGGPDSMALFGILKKLHVPFVVAHIDHGWRKESQQEAEILQKWVGDVPFFLKSCKKSDFKGNLEEAARKARLQYFKEVVNETGAQGVLLAHHADDLAETVLKRILEGASLPHLAPMKKIGQIEGLLVVRPLLDFTKKELKAYLGPTPYFDDETNLSPQLLRGRLRCDIFPYLARAFGKQIEKPLVAVAREAQLLSDYLQEALAPYQAIKGPLGDYIDFTCPPHPFLLQARIHTFLKEKGLPTFRGEIQALSLALQSKKAGFIKGGLLADRGFLFWLSQEMPVWEIAVVPEELPLTDWKGLWTGSAIGWAPDENVWLGFGDHPYDKWWTNHKVPAFLRARVPLLWSREGPVHEFLTGKRKGSEKGVKIRLTGKKDKKV